MRLLLILFLFFSFTAPAQEIYKRNKNESIESFIIRSFPDTKDNIIHSIIEEKWGDTSYLKKVVVFYRNRGSDESETNAIVLQLISNNRYKRLKFDYTFGIGVYPNTSTIESIFFYDTNYDRIKELIVIEHGTVRCLAEVVEYNEETKRNDTITMSASCDLCGFTIFSQKVNSDNIEEIDGDESDESDEWQCDAIFIKGLLEGRKKK
jgi:hypothetical protein